MKQHRLLVWCLIPLGILFFHFLYGEQLALAEDSARLQRLAQKAEQAGNYIKAVPLYLAAENAAHPKDRLLRARARIDAARTITMAGAPLEAAEQIDLLLKPNRQNPLPENFVAEAKATLAMALYYAAYAMRIETASPRMWQSEIDEAVRLFRELYLSEIKTPDKPLASLYARNLEASILLARTRRAELSSQPFPPATRAALEQGVASKKKVQPE